MKEIREIIAQHIGGTYEAKQKCAEEIMQLFRGVRQSEQPQFEQICYKTNEPCKYDCQGLCKDSF